MMTNSASETAPSNLQPMTGGMMPVCPCHLHGDLVPSGDRLVSQCCGREFSRSESVWDLILGERFNDEKCECMWSNEERTGRHLALNYVGPLLKKVFEGRDPATIRVLSVGCGVGSDVEALVSLGFDAYGIDAGNRAEYWSKRDYADRYYLANAKHLPFAAESIDVILMGCVLPHIGVGDDTYETQEGYEEERQLAADEMVRVTRKGGVMVLSSPNRNCPIDFFHRENVANHRPRFHKPGETFLMSRDDYAKALDVGGQCKSIELLPLRGYWGFYSSSTYLLGRIMQMPVRFYFNQVMSWKWTKSLRNTGFNPWLIMLVHK